MVSDLVLPDVRGAQLVLALRREAPGLPVLFITGYGPVAETEELQRTGVAGILQKPLDAAVLSERVRRAIDSRPAPAQVIGGK